MQEMSLGRLGSMAPGEGRCILGVSWAGLSQEVWEGCRAEEGR